MCAAALVSLSVIGGVEKKSRAWSGGEEHYARFV